MVKKVTRLAYGLPRENISLPRWYGSNFLLNHRNRNRKINRKLINKYLI